MVVMEVQLVRGMIMILSSYLTQLVLYLTTYVSTIGIYDKDGDMVAVAKLPQPFKKLPDYDTNFIIRFDT